MVSKRRSVVAACVLLLGCSNATEARVDADAIDASSADTDAAIVDANDAADTGDASAVPSAPPFDIVANHRAVDIVVDSADAPAVLRAVGDLAADVERVSGISPQIKSATTGLSDRILLVGTIGKSGFIDDLVAKHRLDVSALVGKREAFVVRTVDNPISGVQRALVIAGSDRRGTIYGIYDTSEAIGVSPWYYWADVAPAHHDTVTVPGDTRIHGEPSFKYRGIFINDEENFTAWAGALDPGKAPGPETYKKVFELLLRLKANFLWPALHKISKEFSRYPENFENADRYGIVMGSPDSMMRTNLKEWPSWASAHPVNGAVPDYDYSKYPSVVYDYWDARAKEIADRESAYSIGMRGIGDVPIVGGTTPAERVALMQTIFHDQQKIIATRTNPQSGSFQVFLPYKEVLDLYSAGLKVPENAALLWPEDNHGYIRQLPNDAERARSGGSGVYYHLSYWGPPGQSYLWINTTPLSLVREELRKAYDSGAREMLIVNVGDIKPAEIGAELAMRFAYAADDFAGDDVRDFVARLAARDFGPDHAAEIANIVTRYFQINIARRPEFMKKGIYSVVNYGDEAERRSGELADLVARAEAIEATLPKERVDAFYEMVLYPLRASKLTLDKYVAADRADLYAAQGRRKSVAKCRTAATDAYDAIVSDIANYNTKIASGKWNKILNPFNTQMPVLEGVPALASVPPATTGDPLGVVVEGETSQTTDRGALAFSAFTQDTRFIDVFTKSDAGFAWSATASPAWIKLDKTSGTIVDEARIHVSIDWSAVPVGDSVGTVRVASPSSSRTIDVHVSNPSMPTRSSLDGYVEANGYVAIEAEHFTKSTPRGGAEWRVLRDLGRSGDSVKVFPDLAPSVTSGLAANSPSLDYKVYFFSTGTFPVTIYRLPTLNAAGQCRLALGLDDDAPQIVAGANVTQTTEWRAAILAQIDAVTTSLRVTTSGYHTLHLYAVDPSIVVDRMVIDTGGLKASYLGPPESYFH